MKTIRYVPSFVCFCCRIMNHMIHVILCRCSIVCRVDEVPILAQVICGSCAFKVLKRSW